MTLSIRSKLFLISVGLILMVGLMSGMYLKHELRHMLEQRIEAELLRQALATRELVLASEDRSPAAMDALAGRLTGAFDSRVTIVHPDGRLLGESDLALDQLGAADNHSVRPEVIEALASGQGRARRHSTTVNAPMAYVAVPYDHGAALGVVRVARPLAEVDRTVQRLRTLFLLAGLVGLVVAVLMSGLASYFLSRTLRQLAFSARALSRRTIEAGDATRARIDVTSRGGLAGSLNRMADDIASTVSTLASERARFEAVLEGMSEGVIALDGDRRIRLMNRAALELLSLEEAPLDEPLIHHLRAPAIHELLTEPMASGSRELSLPGPRQVLARVTPERNSTGCIIVMHDVTDLRRLETMRRDFVANASHELRTPVSIIRANAETLLDGAMSDEVHGARLLEALHRNAERLSNIIADLLDLSRIEAGRFPVAMDALDLADAARMNMEAVERAARDKGIELVCSVEPGVAVRGDAKALDQILLNYLDNAIKYTPEGGRVEVRARAEGERVRIEVADNGPGIPRHLYERVFERFYRVDPGRSRDMGGTGLGLSIVKHLVDAMDGAAGVDPVEPHGACFWVALPRA